MESPRNLLTLPSVLHVDPQAEEQTPEKLYHDDQFTLLVLVGKETPCAARAFL